MAKARRKAARVAREQWQTLQQRLAEEPSERDRGDDDGVEYADPRDEREARLYGD